MPRGELRIYLGAAPGVGKTVAMLSEGARRAARGTDVVVALCETHGRPHTTAMLHNGLEILGRRQVEYRGAKVQEMDLDAVLRRRPQVALVDELAHTNAPGSHHEKRWQDIQELLDAGIDVISTVNIQHLESLNDAVTAITGVEQRETVPDHVVRSADQVELVDMSPEALRRRMAHGNIYQAERIDAALSNYFRVGNLGALRELALLWLADRVDEAVERYREDHGITGSWPTRERIVVAVSGGDEGATLLRRAARIAARSSGGALHAVYVARSDGLAGPSLPQVARLERLTEELGGTFHTVTGDDASAAVLETARALNATQIVIGASRRPAWRRMFRGGTGDTLIAGSGDIDVLVVAHDQVGRLPARRVAPALSRSRVGAGAALAVILPALLTALLRVLPLGFELSLIVLVYLFATVLVALVGGIWPALAAAVFTSLLINWFFTPPVGTFTIADPHNVASLVVFVATGATVSAVVHLAARRTRAALAAQQESTALAELTHTLLGSTDQMALLLDRAVDAFGARSAAVVQRPNTGGQAVVTDSTTDFRLPAAEQTREEIDAQHDLVMIGPGLPAERQRLLAAYAVHAGAILHRRSLQREAGSAQALARDNRARTALLSAVSHDLRTPLASIKAAIASLRTEEVTFTAEDEAELQAIIEESADRLEALVENLLDMSRLQVGALAARPRVADLADIVVSAVRTLTEPGRVSCHFAPDARWAMADPGLLDRVLWNLLENAVRHCPDAQRIRVTTSRIGDRVEIRVIDHGPGVDATMREQMFVAFQRLGDAPDGRGVGLGLAVARGLIETMHGTVEAEDTPGGGLTMVVSLREGDQRVSGPETPEGLS